MQRPDFDASALSDEALRARFWELAGRATATLIEQARLHTTPAVERSVLLRMGFAPAEADGIVRQVESAGLLGKGAGHVVLRLSRAVGLAHREAGRQLAAGQHVEWLPRLFTGGKEGPMHD